MFWRSKPSGTLDADCIALCTISVCQKSKVAVEKTSKCRDQDRPSGFVFELCLAKEFQIAIKGVNENKGTQASALSTVSAVSLPSTSKCKRIPWI
ncbi:hypothetical protein TNCV_1521461 [Trichonephila clavipes]|nr:hypothetical protein TNCV_1521461 [Trichonephila clavipes]